jgi:hypothetical protein
MSTTRKAPSESATLFKKGTTKKGNDGNRYVIVTNAQGVQRWQKVKAKTRRVGRRVGRRVVELGTGDAYGENIWGKNKPLEKFWRSLASGE